MTDTKILPDIDLGITERTGIFYGTGASEGIPNPFCDCEMCNHARKYSGRNIRKRSCFRVGKDLMIDMGPDIFSQALLYGSLRDIEHVLITHTHDDHFNFEALGLIMMATVHRHKPIHFYLTERAYDYIEELRNSPIAFGGDLRRMESQGLYYFHLLSCFETYEIGKYKVTPVRGNHRGNMPDEKSANYLIQLPDGKKLLYSLDTGLYSEETLEFLKNAGADIWVTECTFGNLSPQEEWSAHLCVETLMEQTKRLDEKKALAPGCPVYVTHINHCHTAYHEKLQSLLDQTQGEHPFTVAYDGLHIEL